MAPGIGLLRKTKSFRSSSSQNQGDYETKPSVTTSTVSSLTCSLTGNTPMVNNETSVMKRGVSRDVTAETETDSLNNSLGASSLPVRRLSSSRSQGSRGSKRKDESVSRKFSIQDEILNRQEEKGEIDTSVSSLTLESDIKLYHKAKSKSFCELRNVPSIKRANTKSKSRRRSSASVTGSYSLERIGEESTRCGTAVTSSSSCSRFSRNEVVSLTLSDLQSKTSTLSKGGRGIESFLNDTRSSRDGFETDSKLSSSNFDSMPQLDERRSKKHALKRILSVGDQSTSTIGSYVSTETLELISSMHETNIENESTILRLQQELSEMQSERDAFRTNSDKIVQVMTSKQTELESQLKKERKGFANMSSKHEKELKNWMDKASLLSSKVLVLEKTAKDRDLDDLTRSERICNLERNMVRLFEMYSCSANEVQTSDLDESEVEKSLSAFDASSSEVERWKLKHARLEKSHEKIVNDNRIRYEELSSEANQYKATIKELENENEVLRRNSADMVTVDDKIELLSKINELTDENAALVKHYYDVDSLKEELNEAKSLAQAAQQSIKGLKAENLLLEEALRVERNKREDTKKPSCSSTLDNFEGQSCRNDCLEDLKKANAKLTEELEEKNEAMKLVKTNLDVLKSEQQSIKETVVTLRMENLKLRDEKEEAAASRPPPPPHPGTMTTKDNTDLESRLNQIKRKNQELRGSNAALSKKLSAESEKTKSLEVANKGLAARICKLVDFIKEQGNG